MPELNQIDVATRRYLGESSGKLIDNVFQQDPLLAFLKANCSEKYSGGRYIPENFWYNGLPGGSYNKGKTFNITQPQVEQQLQFNPKFFEVNVSLFKEDIQVINAGPAQLFSLIKSRMENSYSTISAHMSIALFLNDQAAGYEPNFTGLPVIVNDNGTASWDGSTYATLGTITRGGAVGTALNSIPTNVAGAIQYLTLENTYGAATFGTGQYEPNIGLTTVLGYGYIKQKFQTQQRFNDTQEPQLGFNGMKFNGATLMKTRYCPGSAISAATDPIVVGYLTEMSGGVVTAYPTLTSETLWWLNARKPYLKFYVSTDPEYAIGFTGFKPGQGTTIVCGQVLFAGALTSGGPRYHQQLYGITG